MSDVSISHRATGGVIVYGVNFLPTDTGLAMANAFEVWVNGDNSPFFVEHRVPHCVRGAEKHMGKAQKLHVVSKKSMDKADMHEERRTRSLFCSSSS